MQRSFVANKTIGTFNYPLYFEKTNNFNIMLFEKRRTNGTMLKLFLHLLNRKWLILKKGIA